MSRGHDRERDICELLEAHGWVCVRAAGSLGSIDVVAAVDGQVGFVPGDVASPQTRFLRSLLFIEVKSTAGGPFERFGPKDREELRAAASQAGAEAWLAWWPPRGRLKWIGSDAWPPTKPGRNAKQAPGSLSPFELEDLCDADD